MFRVDLARIAHFAVVDFIERQRDISPLCTPLERQRVPGDFHAAHIISWLRVNSASTRRR